MNFLKNGGVDVNISAKGKEDSEPNSNAKEVSSTASIPYDVEVKTSAEFGSGQIENININLYLKK